MMKIRLLIILWISFWCTLLAEEKPKQNLQKLTVESTKYFDINKIKTAIQNNGVFARNPETGNSGLYFNNVPLIYVSGFWMAAKVDSEIRASAADYFTDLAGSAFDDSGNPFGKEDSTFRVYKISRGDNAMNNPDYAEWPIEIGAPQTKSGMPLIIGDQTLWCSFTDAYPENRSYNPCPPLNAEVHLTVCGLDTLENVVFFHWQFWNHGLKPWHDAYLGCFIDPDIGYTNNNLVGSDSTLSFAYTFEHTNWQQYDTTFAVCFAMLASPIIASFGDTAITFNGPKPDYKNANVLSPLAYKHWPFEWVMPSHGESYAKIWIYRRLSGRDNDGQAMIDSTTGNPTYWGLSGDPINQTGWIDEEPQDRFMMISTGPFDLEPNESNSMTIAVIAVTDSNYFGTIPKLKERSAEVHTFFRKEMKKLTGIQADYSSSNKISSFQLYQNYPNPFNHSTQIKFHMKKSAKARLIIYNVQGQFIKVLLDDFKNAGSHQVVWDGTDQHGQQVSSGLFFYQLKSGDKIVTQKMIHIK